MLLLLVIYQFEDVLMMEVEHFSPILQGIGFKILSQELLIGRVEVGGAADCTFPHCRTNLISSFLHRINNIAHP